MAADLGIIFQFRKDFAGKLFTKLNTPLVKAVNVPDDALGKDLVLIHGNQRA